MSRNLPGKEGEDGFTHVLNTSRNLIKLEQREQGKIIDEAGIKVSHITEFGHYGKDNEKTLEGFLQRKFSRVTV